MATTGPVVDVVGMKALRKDINRLTTDISGPLYKALSAAGKRAVEPVAVRARSSVPHVSGDLAGTIRSGGTRTGGNVRMGKAAIPYAGFVEFGGTRPQGPTDRAARPFIPTGRYLFPAAYTEQPAVTSLYNDELEGLFSRNDIWTNGGASSPHD